jgi:hypothetical protein
MDSQRSNALTHLRRLGDSIRADDWRTAEGLGLNFSHCEVPTGQPEMAEYLEALKQTLILARASRSVAAATLSRVRAAARFQSAAADRQDFADLTESRRTADPFQPLPSDT